MQIPVKLDLAFAALRIALIVAILPFAIGWRTPLFASWRYVALAVCSRFRWSLIAIDIGTLRRARTRALRADERRCASCSQLMRLRRDRDARIEFPGTSAAPYWRADPAAA